MTKIGANVRAWPDPSLKTISSAKLHMVARIHIWELKMPKLNEVSEVGFELSPTHEDQN